MAGKPDESELIARTVSTDESDTMPPKGDRLTPAEVRTLRTWVAEGAEWNALTAGKLTALTDDLTFLRRVTLDAVGVIPIPDEIDAFLADPSPGKQARVIDRLLADPRRAGHWVGYWQDVLAEYPNILKPTLNNSGPFRWWLHEAFLDAKPVDVMVTELVRMRGSVHRGGPAAFGIASENDVPEAEKGAILAGAFLGVNMRCARCHDAPAHKSTQKELFGLAAMLSEEPITVPKTSTVPRDKLHTGRPALISVTLQPGTTVAPGWPFADLLPAVPADAVPADATPRDRLAAMLTAPQNGRFTQVIVNRVWQRLMGRGIVDPVDDWERGQPTHPELLAFLAREFVRSGYDLRAVERLVLNSHAYQRAADPARTEPDPLYAAPARRRLTAEQVVDSLYAAAGKPMNVGAIDLDIDNSGLGQEGGTSLGVPKRAWEFAPTANERDRPSLSLPKVQAVVDVLEAFGWRTARPDPTSVREAAPNVLQPATLANGTVGFWLTRLCDDHAGTRLALEARTPEEVVDRLYLRVLTRRPTAEEGAAMASHLAVGFTHRFGSPPLRAWAAAAAPVAAYDQAVGESLRLAGPKFVGVFDLATESAKLRESYGSEFGQRCLLARRLVESGVRFVEVSHNLNFVNGTGWDTHNDGQKKQHLLVEDLDAALSTLVKDLEARGRLDRTLIAFGSEFGRPAGFDAGGGRGHQGSVFTLVVAGGGLRHRGAYGVTDELSKSSVADPVSVPDYHATIYAALGIDPAKSLAGGPRPVPVTDGGTPIRALFS